jgi:hypothetical protein
VARRTGSDRTPEIATLLNQKPAAEGRIQGIGRHNATEAALDVLRDRMETLRRENRADGTMAVAPVLPWTGRSVAGARRGRRPLDRNFRRRLGAARQERAGSSIATPSRAKLFHEEPEAGKLHIRDWSWCSPRFRPRLELRQRRRRNPMRTSDEQRPSTPVAAPGTRIGNLGSHDRATR